MGVEFSDRDGVVSADLFGWPMVPPRGPGRPAHVPTAESRQFVNMMFVCGHAPMAVAKAIGLKKTAFYEHYKQELAEREHAGLKFKGRQMLRLNTQAEAGNVAAEKALAGMIQAERMRAESARFDQPDRKAKPAPIGKKQEQQAKAWDAGKGDEDWGGLLHGEVGAALPN